MPKALKKDSHISDSQLLRGFTEKNHSCPITIDEPSLGLKPTKVASEGATKKHSASTGPELVNDYNEKKRSTITEGNSALSAQTPDQPENLEFDGSLSLERDKKRQKVDSETTRSQSSAPALVSTSKALDDRTSKLAIVHDNLQHRSEEIKVPGAVYDKLTGTPPVPRVNEYSYIRPQYHYSAAAAHSSQLNTRVIPGPSIPPKTHLVRAPIGPRSTVPIGPRSWNPQKVGAPAMNALAPQTTSHHYSEGSKAFLGNVPEAAPTGVTNQHQTNLGTKPPHVTYSSPSHPQFRHDGQPIPPPTLTTSTSGPTLNTPASEVFMSPLPLSVPITIPPPAPPPPPPNVINTSMVLTNPKNPIVQQQSGAITTAKTSPSGTLSPTANFGKHISITHPNSSSSSPLINSGKVLNGPAGPFALRKDGGSLTPVGPNGFGAGHPGFQGNGGAVSVGAPRVNSYPKLYVGHHGAGGYLSNNGNGNIIGVGPVVVPMVDKYLEQAQRMMEVGSSLEQEILKLRSSRNSSLLSQEIKLKIKNERVRYEGKVLKVDVNNLKLKRDYNEDHLKNNGGDISLAMGF
ncbi:hypothetical protein BY996DRAFT_8047127 [Phakopsora pachyrhizi]|nr:hypothetical protein BY996DRAFT_8047127 [Phakopsora pachyrhizi]